MNWRRLAFVAALLGGTAVALGSWILFTESGLRWSVNTASRMSGGVLTVRSARGRLAGHVHLSRVSVHTTAFNLSVESLNLRLAPSGLLRMTLVIDTAAAEDVILTLPPPSGQMTVPIDPLNADPLNLPVGIEINQLTVRDLTLSMEPSYPVSLDTLRFSGSVQRDRAVIDSFRLISSDASLEMNGEVQFSPVPGISAETAWSFQPSGMPRHAQDHRPR